MNSATFSPDRVYRYILTRSFDSGHGTCVFIGLNPSTADETKDDPTIRRCMRYAKDWGYERLVMLNLYGFRATNPEVMLQAADPVGPINIQLIKRETRHADMIICAWGAKADPIHAQYVLSLLPTSHALGLTASGQPRHPLYMPLTAKPMRFALRK